MRIVKEDSTHAEVVRSRLKNQMRLSHLTTDYETHCFLLNRTAMDWNAHDGRETMKLSQRLIPPHSLWLKAGTCLRLGRNESLVTGPQCDLGARRQAYLREHTAHVGFHRPFAYYQQLGHLGIGFALPNQCC